MFSVIKAIWRYLSVNLNIFSYLGFAGRALASAVRSVFGVVANSRLGQAVFKCGLFSAGVLGLRSILDNALDYFLDSVNFSLPEVSGVFTGAARYFLAYIPLTAFKELFTFCVSSYCTYLAVSGSLISAWFVRSVLRDYGAIRE